MISYSDFVDSVTPVEPYRIDNEIQSTSNYDENDSIQESEREIFAKRNQQMLTS
jgi:hypothetical protein